MNFKEAYQLGQERKKLEITAKEYDAWPKGLTISGGLEGVESMVSDINDLTKEVRETAQQKAEGLKSPNNFLGIISFNLGYFIGPHATIKSICTSDGPVNPFTEKALYQK